MVRRTLFTAVGVIATLALYMLPAAATSEPVTKIHFTLAEQRVPAGSDVAGLVHVTSGSGKEELPFGGASLTVWIDGVQVGSATADGAGVAAVSYPTSKRGPHTIRVAFAGDAHHKKAHKDREFIVTRGEPGQDPPPDPTTTTTPPPDPTETTTPPPDPTTTTTPPPDPTETTTPPPDPTTTTPPPDPTTTTPPPGPVPDAPTIFLTETPQPRYIYLQWSVPSDNGSEITRFNIYRGLTSGGETFLRGRNPTFDFVDDFDVVSGVTYYYVVTAVNANGESVWSNEVSVVAL